MYLSVRVLHRGDVGVSEGAFHKAKDQRTLPDTAGSEHDHPVVVTLLRHSGSWSPPAALDESPAGPDQTSGVKTTVDQALIVSMTMSVSTRDVTSGNELKTRSDDLGEFPSMQLSHMRARRLVKN